MTGALSILHAPLPGLTQFVTVGESLIAFSSDHRWRSSAAAHVRTAGAESNVAIAVVRLGGTATWMGRVGADGLGERVIADLQAEGLVVKAVLDPSPTSLIVKERRHPDLTRVEYHRGDGPGAHLRPEDLDPASIAGAAILHLTGVTAALSASALETVRAAIAIAKSAGVLVSFDVNYRSKLWSVATARPVLRVLAAEADLLFVGDDELHLLTHEIGDDLTAAEWALDQGVREVVLKRGARGAAAVVRGRIVETDARRTRVVDAVGAGDAFAGGYIAELLAGHDLDARLATGVACGAAAVASAGDWEDSLTRADLRALDSSARVDR
ncbi:2-dehydro-3-deoxygluconokinase [Microbacterium sp. SLBN-154]|uniref:sugar kinase n=1 Tax=Microbacterium sp. SLBN-154 TaxID=2768458 RepID=UPI00114D664C|nr:sugar kinase [Microbacterium sp. SLBN-154]TQK17668.1 2-dehydro-3-deoxygluconokinase [Microbacterium sp. SLBN-154]